MPKVGGKREKPIKSVFVDLACSDLFFIFFSRRPHLWCAKNSAVFFGRNDGGAGFAEIIRYGVFETFRRQLRILFIFGGMRKREKQKGVVKSRFDWDDSL